MKRVECCHEDDVLDALTSGRWPDRADDRLRTHVAACAICADIVDVSGAIPPDSWMNLRREQPM